MNPFYKDYAEYLSEIFPGKKVQKISVNAGFTCPNRDGTIGTGGCIYCNNSSFSPAYCLSGDHSPARQIEDGKRFFAKKYPDMRYLAYFQSFTNTYGRDPGQLLSLWEEAAACKGVVGLIIGTRPDTLDDETIKAAALISHRIPVIFEIGAETSSDNTLRLINRGHTWNDVADTAYRLKKAGLHCGLHLIAGLPGEDTSRALRTIDDACSLPIDSIKLHQLQILRNTPLADMYEKGQSGVIPFSLEEYLDFCMEVIRKVPRTIAIERFLSQAPPDMIIAPRWGLKNHEFTNMLLSRMRNAKQ